MMLPSLHQPESEKPGSQQRAKPPSFPSGEDRRAQVLVVEDDAQMALMIAAALEALYRVTTASDGQEGLEQALALHPDLILCDVLMPRMDGEQLVAVLRARPDFDDVPIVVLSGRVDERLRVQLLRTGAQDYLVKPFHHEELRVRVANLLMVRQVRQVLQQEVKQQGQGLVALASELAQQQRELTKQRDELLLLNEALERAHRGKQFFSTMSHELRTPLASIIGFSQLLLAGAQEANWNQQQQSNLERILKNAQHLLELINDVLDLVKIEAGRMEITYSMVDVRELLDCVAEETQSIAIKKNLVVRAVIGEEVRFLESNEVRLRQILLNLVSNALKFTERGGVTISAARGQVDQIVFRVKDTGMGIPKGVQERIFEAFYQVAGPYVGKADGTGLGLSIVSQLTGLLGGKIELTSAPGEGSEFRVILPIKATHQDRDLVNDGE